MIDGFFIIDSQIKKQIKKALAEIEYIGAMSFEFFEDQDRTLIVNEVAPRVHNSAHYSLNALSLDQFQAHLFCASGESLKSVALAKGSLAPICRSFAMVNLIGKVNQPVSNEKLAAVRPRIAGHGFLHWYGKTEERQGRKMGHINVCGLGTPAQSLRVALSLEKEFFRDAKRGF